MPALDRRITVRRTLTTRDLFGEHDLDVTDYPQWATRLDLSQADKEQAGGVLTQASRAYIVRYRAALADALTSEISIIDGGLTLNATNITEATLRGERRKFLRIECTGKLSNALAMEQPRDAG